MIPSDSSAPQRPSRGRRPGKKTRLWFAPIHLSSPQPVWERWVVHKRRLADACTDQSELGTSCHFFSATVRQACPSDLDLDLTQMRFNLERPPRFSDNATTSYMATQLWNNTIDIESYDHRDPSMPANVIVPIGISCDSNPRARVAPSIAARSTF